VKDLTIHFIGSTSVIVSSKSAILNCYIFHSLVSSADEELSFKQKQQTIPTQKCQINSAPLVTSAVVLVKNLVTSHNKGKKDGIATPINGIYPWLFIYSVRVYYRKTFKELTST